MPATPKSLRQPPPRNFEDYSLTYETDPAIGQYPISDLILKSVPGYTGEPGAKDAYEEIEVGFGFIFDQKTYTRAIVSTSGWVALATSNAGIVTPSSLFGESNTVSNWSIHIKNAGCILLAPWFDALASVTVADDYNDPLQKYRKGIDPYNGALNQTKAGVKFFRGNDQRGRYFLVRWSSYVDATNINILDFDCLVYENGTIEYRYSPPKDPYKENDPAVEYAVVGLFLPSNAPGTNYRDCGNILSNAADSRGLYRRGGTVWDNVYTDTANSNTSNYTISLSPPLHWPAMGNNGAVFRFSPPVNKRRNNRRIITARDSKPISPAGTFDDRKTTYFVADTVSYPVGLPVNRPYTTSHKGIHSTLDLFSLNDLELTRTGSSGMYDQLLEETLSDATEDGFREVALHEQGRFDEQFYAIGSLIQFGEEPGAFSSGLKSKETLRLSFPVKTSTQMLGTSSCVYYYNREFSRWNIPTGSIGDVRGPFDAFSFDTRWLPGFGTTEQRFTPGTFVSEDAIGFDAYGRAIASGSADIYRTVFTSSNPGEFNQTIPFIASAEPTNQQLVNALTNRHEKSLPQSADYAPTEDEVFVLPITEPFSIEKVVFEIPMAMGSGWFDDITSTNFLLVSASYKYGSDAAHQLYGTIDRGGPTMTVSLMCQKQQGDKRVLEIVASGTISHDNDSRFLDAYCIDVDPEYTPKPYVFLTPAGTLDASVRVTSETKIFTGTIAVPTIAAVSNGMSLAHWTSFVVNSGAPSPPVYSWSPEDILAWTKNVLSSSQYRYNNSDPRYEETLTVVGINPAGRALQGFYPGGGSVFSSDFVTPALQVGPNCSFSNPYSHGIPSNFITTAYQNFSASINEFSTSYPTKDFYIMMSSDIDVSGHRTSPYLVKPGDKLVLVVSKTRPSVNFVSGSITSPSDADVGRGTVGKVKKAKVANCRIMDDVKPHDAQFITGSINLSIYGSYISENRGRS